MTHAYSNIYLSDAEQTLAAMFDYAINDCGYAADAFAMLFVQSGVAELFGKGHPSYVSGMSGTELALETFDYLLNPPVTPAYGGCVDRSPEYWAGMYLAYFQWQSGYSFIDIFRRVPFSEVVSMYHPYHEMDVELFCSEMEARMANYDAEHPVATGSHLRHARELRGMSQSELATASGVNIRNIQMYEQGVNDIRKAQVSIVCKLAAALCCSVEGLVQ